MRSSFIVAVLALSVLPATVFAQSTITQPNPQTAALGSPATPPAASPSVTVTGVTREQYLQRAHERAEQRAAARFDQMDANHDGVLDRGEIRAWRSQHPRHVPTQ